MTLRPRDLAFWDEGRRAWRVEAGRFDILGGFSAADLPGRASVTRDTDLTLAP